jgi:hypothetical protein
VGKQTLLFWSEDVFTEGKKDNEANEFDRIDRIYWMNAIEKRFSGGVLKYVY